MGPLHRTDQEYLGRGNADRGKGGGVLTLHEDKGRHWEPVPSGFHQHKGSHGHLAGGEITGVERVGENSVGGHPQASAVHLQSTAEVTPTGVIIRAEGHS